VESNAAPIDDAVQRIEIQEYPFACCARNAMKKQMHDMSADSIDAWSSRRTGTPRRHATENP
jgi:hypothetical protein